MTFAASALLSMGVAQANDSIMKAQADPNNWPSYGRTYENTRFSPLKQINTKNVGKLQLAYAFSLASLRSNESTPIVIGDTLYVSSSWGPKSVFALNAATGALKWTYQPDIPDDVLQYGCCDVNNRGVTYADGKIFVGRLDGNLTALDAKTGTELWTTKVVDYTQGSIITSPPLVVGNKVITGFGGGEYGARGSLQAYDINTGKQIWKTWTVPDPKSPGGDSWKGDSYQHGGGAAWLVGSYDAKTNTIFYGTSNPSPWATKVRSTGDSNYGKLTNLYTSSTLALNPDTGAIKWAVQSTPADAWDYDGVNELVLANVKIAGKVTPIATASSMSSIARRARSSPPRPMSRPTGPSRSTSPPACRSKIRPSVRARTIPRPTSARTCSAARTGSRFRSARRPVSPISRPIISARTCRKARSIIARACSTSARISRPRRARAAISAASRLMIRPPRRSCGTSTRICRSTAAC